MLCAGKFNPAEQIRSDNAVQIYRVRDWLLNAASRVTPGAGGVRSVGNTETRNTVANFLRGILRAVWRAIYWPDYSWGWVIPAIFSARKLCIKNKYDWIISVSHPFSGHVVGLAAVRMSPKSSWFVDISDPYSNMKDPSPNNFHIYSWLNKATEGVVIKGATEISVTTDATRDLYEASFPVACGKTHVIPPLLSLPEVSGVGFKGEDNLIRLVYIGTLYKSLRSPKYLLKCLEVLSERLTEQRMELHFYGSVNDCSEDFAAINEHPNLKIIIHGIVSRAVVVRAMAEADILVNIGNDAKAQLASKVIEYIAMAKPILNTISIEDDSSLKVLSTYSSVLTIFREDGGISSSKVEELRSFVLNPPAVDPVEVAAARARYSAPSVAGIYASILEKKNPTLD